MARSTGPMCRICRHRGLQLSMKGARCFGPEHAIGRRRSSPAGCGLRRRSRSEHASPLKEKQQSRSIDGVPTRMPLTSVLTWPTLDVSGMRGQAVRVPGRVETEVIVNTQQLVVEFYSR